MVKTLLPPEENLIASRELYAGQTTRLTGVKFETRITCF